MISPRRGVCVESRVLLLMICALHLAECEQDWIRGIFSGWHTVTAPSSSYFYLHDSHFS